MTGREKLGALILGAGAGAIVGLIVWRYAQSRLERDFAKGTAQLAQRLGLGEEQLRARIAEGREQLRGQIARDLPPIVRATFDQRLSSYGITPETGRQLARLLAIAEDRGLLR